MGSCIIPPISLHGRSRQRSREGEEVGRYNQCGGSAWVAGAIGKFEPREDGGRMGVEERRRGRPVDVGVSVAAGRAERLRRQRGATVNA